MKSEQLEDQIDLLRDMGMAVVVMQNTRGNLQPAGAASAPRHVKKTSAEMGCHDTILAHYILPECNRAAYGVAGHYAATVSRRYARKQDMDVFVMLHTCANSLLSAVGRPKPLIELTQYSGKTSDSKEEKPLSSTFSVPNVELMIADILHTKGAQSEA